MKVPLSWLKEIVPIRLKAEALAEKLTYAGLEVEQILDKEGDPVLEINVTPNRGDCLSLLGIAREVSALLGSSLCERRRRSIPKKKGDLFSVNDFLSVDLKNPEGCPRYTARVIRNLTVGPSPSWLVKRLEQVGLRSVNNVVDLTNYVMLECGQPLHAFDLQKIEGEGKAQIIIRKARRGEVFETLDGKRRELKEEDLLIADLREGIAVAGLMGGKNSEVSERTRHIVLESAFFNPHWIRQSSRRLGLSSDSSYRFERGVDPEGVINALNRATEMILELAGGVASRDWVDRYPRKIRRRLISLDPSSVEEKLGGTWSSPDVKKYLKRLHLKPKGSSWEIPSYRGDLQFSEDLVEEVARLGGYNKIPLTYPQVIVMKKRSADRSLIKEIKRRMVELGFYESIHMSFLSPGDLDYDPTLLGRAVPLANPLGAHDSLLRPTLIPSLLKTLSFHHLNRMFDMRLYELRTVFWREGRETREAPALGFVMSGSSLGGRLNDRRKEVDYFDAKGVIEGVFGLRRLEANFEAASHPLLLPGKSARLSLAGEEIGWIGELHPSRIEGFALSKGAVLGEIFLRKFLDFAQKTTYYSPYPRVPLVERDLSLLVDEAIPAEKILGFLREQKESLVQRVRVFDYYKGDQISEGKKSLAFSLLLGRPDRTLTEEEISEAWGRILESVRREFHADIR